MTSNSKRTAVMAPLALGAALVCLAGVASARHFTPPSLDMRAGTAGHVHQAQAKQVQPLKLIVDVSVQGKAGDKLKFPARLEPAGADTAQFVMLHQVPAWLKVVGGEAVGNGVWLVPARALGATELQFEASATGRQEVVVSFLAANGTDVQSESKLVINVAASAPANAPRTWQSLVAAGAGAAGSAAAPAEGAKAAPASPAAAAGTVSAFPANTRTDAEMVQYARHLVRECTTCHSLFGNDVGIPVMVGLTRERFIETMNLYKSGRRDHGPMKAVAESLDESETLALALYLSRIRPAAVATAPVATGTTGAASAAGSPVTLNRRTSTEKPERIEGWLKRGQDFLKAGEIVQARLMLERAAEHGSAAGAYLLGTSYDPNVLQWRPGMGLEANAARARDWYNVAKQLGPMPDADRRLADLR